MPNILGHGRREEKDIKMLSRACSAYRCRARPKIAVSSGSQKADLMSTVDSSCDLRRMTLSERSCIISLPIRSICSRYTLSGRGTYSSEDAISRGVRPPSRMRTGARWTRTADEPGGMPGGVESWRRTRFGGALAGDGGLSCCTPPLCGDGGLSRCTPSPASQLRGCGDACGSGA